MSRAALLIQTSMPPHAPIALSASSSMWAGLPVSPRSAMT
jgi:hypothetical protein